MKVLLKCANIKNENKIILHLNYIKGGLHSCLTGNVHMTRKSGYKKEEWETTFFAHIAQKVA